MMNSRIVTGATIAVLSLVATACGDAPRTASTTPSSMVGDSASGDIRAAAAAETTATTVAAARLATSEPAADSNRAGSGGGGRKTAPDSAILLQIATQPKLRTKADSISFVASVRTGLKS